MIQEARRENALFADKKQLDGSLPAAGPPVGREKEAGELVRALAGCADYVASFVFMYGRTGSGKSTVVKFVCERMLLTYRMVNLRKARTVFGCANLILEELGGEVAKRGRAAFLFCKGFRAGWESWRQRDRLCWCLTSLTLSFPTSAAERPTLSTGCLRSSSGCGKRAG